MKRSLDRGFTLVELLVVIAIIAVLIATMIPAMQSSRDAARRATCTNNLMQLSLALHNYESAYQVLPAGVTNPTGPIQNLPVGNHMGWIARVLPYLDEKNVFDHVDLSASVYGPENATARAIEIDGLICPAESGEMQNWLVRSPDAGGPEPGGAADVKVASASYTGCHHDVEAPIDADNHGVLFLNSRIRYLDIPDGLAHTIFIGEKRYEAGDLGWMSGTRATLRNTGTAINDTPLPWRLKPGVPAGAEGNGPTAASPTYVGGFGSYHAGGIALFAFGDGSVKVLSETINPKIYALLANRADGQMLDAADIAP